MATIGDVDRNVTITFIGRDNASRAMSSIGSSASRTSRIVGGLTKALKYAGIAAAAALAAGALLAAKALWDATKAAYADDLAMKKLAFTQMKAQDATKAQTKATSAWIDKMELSTRFADDELRPAYTQLALTGMSVSKSTDLMRVAMDLAEAKGKPLLSVTEALAKGYNGTTTSLSKMGVKVTDEAGNALSFAEILKTLKERTKGAAKEAARTDPWTVMGHAIEQVREEIGKEFLPLFKQFTRWVIDKAVPWIKNEFVPAVKKFSAWIKDEAVPWIQNKLIPALKDGWKEFEENWLPTLKDLVVTGGKFVGKVLALAGAIGDLLGKFGGSGEGGVAKFFDLLAMAINNALIPLRAVLGALGFMIDKWTWLIDHAAAFKDAVFSNEAVDPSTPGASTTVGPRAAPPSAAGGFLKRAMGGWTLVGEHGPELINNRGFVRPHSASMGGAGGGGGGVTLIFNAPQDPVSVGREVRKALLSVKRAEGGRALGLA